MDVFDEFEFKPLTEGLGFHKKQISLKEERKKADQNVMKNSKALSDKEDLERISKPNPMEDIKSLVEDFPTIAHDFIEDEPQAKKAARVENPLPRNDLSTKEVLNKEEPDLKVDPEIFERKIDIVPEMKPLLDKTNEKIKIEKKRVESIEKTRPSLAAQFIDVLTIVGLTNVFLAALLVVTNIDIVYILSHPSTGIVTKISLLTLFASVWLFYLLVSRVFFSKTLGEWAMDLELGNKKDQLKLSYPLKITARFFVNALTGVVLLPILSLLTKRDLLGNTVGLSLYKRCWKWE